MRPSYRFRSISRNMPTSTARSVRSSSQSISSSANVLVLGFPQNSPTRSARSRSGSALIWSGWRDDVDLLHTPCVVIKAGPKEEASNAELAVEPTLTDTPANLPTPP
jgi:hypothetical protein